MRYAAKLFLLPALLLTSVVCISAQDSAPVASEYAEDGSPVLIKNLPGPDSVRASAVWATTVADLERVVGPQPVLDLVTLVRGVEAAAAVYPEGRLLLVEYPTPQFSVEADAAFQARLSTLVDGPKIHYRRIGNYSAFVFEAKDEVSANALFDQIKYAKTVQWLGEDPNYQFKVERYLAVSTANIFIGTLIAIVTGAAIAVGIGIVVGLVYFKREEKRRRRREAYSDAGGMTRLNLDELTESEDPEKD